MSDILRIGRAHATRKTAQDALGTTIGTSDDLQVPPDFETRGSSRGSFVPQPLLKIFERCKTVWTLSSLWTQRTRPQGTWKTAKTAVFHSVHTDRFFLEEEEKNEEKLQVCQFRLSQWRGSPHSAVPEIVPAANRRHQISANGTQD